MRLHVHVNIVWTLIAAHIILPATEQRPTVFNKVFIVNLEDVINVILNHLWYQSELFCTKAAV